jgi:hypothetical protein
MLACYNGSSSLYTTTVLEQKRGVNAHLRQKQSGTLLQ